MFHAKLAIILDLIGMHLPVEQMAGKNHVQSMKTYDVSHHKFTE